jgi:hypothetical protein
MYFIQHGFICRPSDSTVSEDAGIKPRTVATSALTVRRSNHSARSHPLRLVGNEDTVIKTNYQADFVKSMSIIHKANCGVRKPPN